MDQDERDDGLWPEDEGWWDRTRTWWDSLPAKTRTSIVSGCIGLATWGAWAMFRVLTNVPGQ